MRARLLSLSLGLALALSALPARAGLFEDLKQGATEMRDSIHDVKSTKDEGKGVVKDAKDLADDTAKDVNSVVPKTETPAAPSADAPPPPPSAVSAPPPPSATQWSIDVGNGQTKTVAQSELKGLIQSGQLSKDTPVYSKALGAWTPAGEVPALKSYFAK